MLRSRMVHCSTFVLQGACVGSGQFLSEVDVNEETVSELLRCYISATGNNLEEVSVIIQLYV